VAGALTVVAIRLRSARDQVSMVMADLWERFAADDPGAEAA
jgi:hypothetical protein